MEPISLSNEFFVVANDDLWKMGIARVGAKINLFHQISLRTRHHGYEDAQTRNRASLESQHIEFMASYNCYRAINRVIDRTMKAYANYAIHVLVS